MSDQDERALERLAKAGNQDAAVELQRLRCRRGEHTKGLLGWWSKPLQAWVLSCQACETILTQTKGNWLGMPR